MAERHETIGIWLEDLLNAGRRIWLVDYGMEASAKNGIVIGMRLFDAGLFHAGFGIVVTPDEDTVDDAISAKARGARLPFRYSLAATLYGDTLRSAQPIGPGDLPLIEQFVEIMQHLSHVPDVPPSRKNRKQKPALSEKAPAKKVSSRRPS